MGLIDRLKDRIQAGPSIDMHHLAPEIRPQPPVSAAEIAEAEEQLGFELPPLVRDLYTQVADGGYGPGYGLVPLAELVQQGREFEKERVRFPWPAKVLHLCWWGCEYFSVLDGSAQAGPVLRFVPDDSRAEALVPEAESLAEWLEAWLRGERLWDRVRAEPVEQELDLIRTHLEIDNDVSQTGFDVVLEAIGAYKIDVIKVVRTATGLGLKEAKDLVESAPMEIKTGISKEFAETLTKALEDAGATVKIRAAFPPPLGDV